MIKFNRHYVSKSRYIRRICSDLLSMVVAAYTYIYFHICMLSYRFFFLVLNFQLMTIIVLAILSVLA